MNNLIIMIDVWGEVIIISKLMVLIFIIIGNSNAINSYHDRFF